MKAIHLTAPRTTVLADIPVPETPPDGLLLKTRCVSICSTDISYYEGYLRPATYPIVMGHEYLGEVVEKGPDFDANDVEIGDRIVYWGQTDFGGFAEYRSLRPIFSGQVKHDPFWTERYFLDDWRAAAVKIPDTISDLEAPLLEPTTAALRAILTHPPKPGDRVLVLGTGPIGVIAGSIIRKLFAPNLVVSVDANPQRNVYALGSFSQGAYTPAELAANVEENSFDYVFDGLPTIKAVDDELDPRRIAMRKIVPRGRYVLYGASQEMQKFDTWLMLSKGLNVMSAPFDVASFPMHRTADVLRSALQLIATGVVDAKSLCTTVCRFEDYDQLADILATYRTTTQMKTVIDFRRLNEPSHISAVAAE